MADSQVNIQLKTTATGDGAQKTAAGLSQVEQAANKVSNAQNKTAGSSRNMGNALLQGSRAIQDMQYGLAGAVNNLEGIASALGLGAGVAGTVTVLAVALQQLGPQLVQFLSSFSADKVRREGLDALVKQLGEAPPAIDRAAAASAKFQQSQSANEQALKLVNETLRDNLRLIELQIAAQRSEADFKAEQAIQDIKAQGLADEAERIAAARLQQAEAQKKLDDERSIAALLGAASERDAAQAAAQAAAAQAAAMDAKLENTARYNELLKEQKRLEDELAQAQSDAAKASAAGFTSPAIAAGVSALRQRLATNQSAQAAALTNGAGIAVDQTGLMGDVLSARASAATQRSAAARRSAQVAQEETQRAAERDAALQRERERIAREARGGVFGPNLAQPASPFGPAPLPTVAPVGGGGLPPPNPLGGLGPLPGTARDLATAQQQATAVTVENAKATADALDAAKKEIDRQKREIELINQRLKNQR